MTTKNDYISLPNMLFQNVKLNKYIYIIDNSGASSSKYGNCAICGKHCTEVFFQSEMRLFVRHDGSIGKTHADCSDYIGHEKCLIGVRKQAPHLVVGNIIEARKIQLVDFYKI